MSFNTVFVIRAGASKEANLPTGYELKSQIAQLLDMRFDNFGHHLEHGDPLIVDALRIHVRQTDDASNDINPYLQQAWRIRDALPQAISIDNFIDAHRDNDKIALCGKLAIVRSILDAEEKSRLFFEKKRIDSTINFKSLEKTWYISFFQLLTENCGKNDLEKRFKTITLIIFNYDRCIEHFIYHSLQNYYGISEGQAAELVKEINIYHPYGNVGTLPWAKGTVEFGARLNSNQLLELSQKIKTFTEGTDPESSEISEIRRHMSSANKVAFIGFAFHKLNMQLITPEKDSIKTTPSNSCFATTHGISDSDKEVVAQQIEKLFHSTIHTRMANLTCAEFFIEYWRSLSF